MKRLLLALALTGCAHKPVILQSSCITPAQLAELRAKAPPSVKSQLDGNAEHDLRIIAGSAIRLREYSDGLLSVLEVCAR